MAKLSAYQFTAGCIRYFCSTCGSHCFVDHPEKENEWYCLGGIIDPPESTPVKDIISITSHAYIDDAVDGGVAPLLLSLSNNYTDNLFPAVRGKDAITPDAVMSMAKKALKHPLATADDRLLVKCHCGGISLRVLRADFTNDPFKVKSHMIPANPNKYCAWYCSCRSCRLATGASLWPTVYVPPEAISSALTDEPIVFGPAAEEPGANAGLKLKYYRSSDEGQRSFCSGCGATVFYCYLGDDGDGVVNISAGILRADSGAMAREWFEWKEGHISWQQELVDQSQGECVNKGWKVLGLGQE